MKNFLSKLLLPPSGDTYLTLEVSDRYLRGTLFFATGDNLNLLNVTTDTFTEPVISTDESAPTPPPSAEKIRSFINSLSIPRSAKVILLGGPTIAITIPAWIKVTRSDWRREVDEGELENIISQAVWKFLNFYKPRALKTLNVTDTEILLARIRILNVRVNNHRVLNPIGFRAKTIEILVEETFVNRDLYAAVEESLPSFSPLVSTAALGISEALLLLRASGFERRFSALRLLPESLLVLKGDGHSRYHGNLTEPIIDYRLSLPWSRSRLLAALGGALGVSKNVSEELFTINQTAAASHRVLRFLKQVLDDGWRSLLRQLPRDLNDVTFLISDYELPASFLRLDRKRPFLLNDCRRLAADFGYSLSAPDDNVNSSFTAIAAFIEHHNSGDDSELNRLAERRAKWLIPAREESNP